MCECQADQQEGRVYVCREMSIHNVGQHTDSTDCGYFAGYAVKAYHDSGSDNPFRATMSRHQVYDARNRIEPTTTRTFTASHQLAAIEAGRYMATIGMGGYDLRAISLTSPRRAYLSIIPDLCRDKNGILFPSFQTNHWYSLVAAFDNGYFIYDPSPRNRGGDPEEHLAAYTLDNEEDLGNLDTFFGMARPGIVCLAQTEGADEGEWE